MNCHRFHCNYVSDNNFCRLDGLECDRHFISPSFILYDTCRFNGQFISSGSSDRKLLFSLLSCEKSCSHYVSCDLE